MSYETVQPISLADVYHLYCDHIKATYPDRADGIINQTKTALLRYTLPGLGYLQPIGKRLTAKEAAEASAFMKKVPLEKIWDALPAQEQVFTTQKVSSNTQHNYRYYLRMLLEWCNLQDWSTALIQPEVDSRTYLFRAERETKSLRELKVTNKQVNLEVPHHYGLKRNEIPPNLNKEISRLHEFLTEIQQFNNQDKPLRSSTAEIHTTNLTSFFGWLHRYKNVPLSELSLKNITQVIRVKDVKNLEQVRKKARKAANETMELVTEYLKWLRKERKVSPTRELHCLSAFVVACKFLYCRETNFPEVVNYDDILVIKLLRAEQAKVKDRQKSAQLVSDKDKKWLEWPEYLKAVEVLRQECTATKAYGYQRNDTAIAKSYQDYLLAAFLGYIPPDRLRTYAELEVNRTLAWKDEKWWIHLLPEDYKTGSVYGEYWGLVPNMKFNDGSCFYEYIDTWLNKWRKVFKPKDNTFFVNRKGKSYSTNTSGMGEIFQAVMYRITGKAVTPHLLRNIFVTYLYDRGESDAVMASVAYTMHHSSEMQRRIYDNRTQEKRGQRGLDIALEIANQILMP